MKGETTKGFNHFYENETQIEICDGIELDDLKTFKIGLISQESIFLF